MNTFNTKSIFENNALLHCLSFNRQQLDKWTNELFQWLFCIHPEYTFESEFLKKETELRESLSQFVKQVDPLIQNSTQIAEQFFGTLPKIHKTLLNDLEAMFNSDPAAKSVNEVLLAYPGFYAIAIHRIAHEMWLKELHVISRLLAEYSHFKTGIDIHPAAVIGERFSIDHGTGVVIGETCVIGNDVKIYQGVTLGALSVSRQNAETKRHPSIGDRVVLYANATILGGNTLIGNDSVIGGNVWITQSIPARSMVYHKSEIVIKNNSIFPEPLNYVI